MDRENTQTTEYYAYTLGVTDALIMNVDTLSPVRLLQSLLLQRWTEEELEKRGISLDSLDRLYNHRR